MNKFLSALTAAVLPVVALVGLGASSPANAVAGPFNCSPAFYQVSAGKMFTFNPADNSFAALGNNAAISSLNALAYNPADNYVYGISGSNIYRVANDGSITISHTASSAPVSTGGDFYPALGANIEVTHDAAGKFNKVNVLTGAVSTFTSSPTNTWAAYDMTIVGNTGYGMNGSTLWIGALSTGGVTVTSAATTGISDSSSGSWGAAYSDAAGDAFFYNNGTKSVYEITAANLAAHTYTLQLITTATNGTLGSPNDGASCPGAASPLAPTVTTSSPATSITDTSATLSGTVATGASASAAVPTNGIQICYSLSSDVHNGLLSVSPTCAAATPSHLANGSAATAVSTGATGLTAGTTYYYQVSATNSVPLVGFGAVRNFSTTGGVVTDYTITWDTNGGSANPTPSTVSVGSAISALPADPTQAGYTFAGWFDESNIEWFAGDVPSGSMTLHAHWIPDSATTWNLTWDVRGGTPDSFMDQVSDGSNATFPSDPTKSGFTFAGWFTDPTGGTQVSDPFTVTVDGTLYAHWTANPPAPTTYNVYFTNLGGYVSQGGGVAGAVINCPSAPARPGYTFKGWGSCAAGASYTITGNITLEAQWEKTTVAVTFTSNGSTVNTQNPTPGSVIDCPAVPTRAGYTFLGWPGCVDGKYTVTGAATIDAAWDKTAYPVTFTSNGSTVNSVNATVGSVIDCPAAPSRAGYTFLGWPGCVDGKYTVTGAATVVAQWIENLAPVPNPPAAGGGQTDHSQQPTTLLPNSDKDGLKLTAPGWTLDLIGQDQGVNVPLDALGRIVFQEGHMAHTSGSGFKPNSDVHVYIFSTPILLGILHTDANGTFVGDLPLPAGLNVGDHTVQVDGYAPDNSVRTADVPVVYAAAKPVTLTKSVYFTPDSTVLSKYTINKITNLVKNLPAGSTLVTAKIVGFVYPINSAAANKKISDGRAKNIAALLKKLGVKGNFTVIGAGRDKVADPTARRVDVAITYTELVTAP